MNPEPNKESLDAIVKSNLGFLGISLQIGRTLVRASQDDASMTLYFDGGTDPRQAKGLWKLQIIADKITLDCCAEDTDK